AGVVEAYVVRLTDVLAGTDARDGRASAIADSHEDGRAADVAHGHARHHDVVQVGAVHSLEREAAGAIEQDVADGDGVESRRAFGAQLDAGRRAVQVRGDE